MLTATTSEHTMFAPARMLDPLRIVQGVGNGRYDCPDLTTLDRHLDHLRCRIVELDDRASDVADRCRADIDRLLDRRSWLTLPTAAAAGRR
jgi:hypothetical protein